MYDDMDVLKPFLSKHMQFVFLFKVVIDHLTTAPIKLLTVQTPPLAVTNLLTPSP